VTRRRWRTDDDDDADDDADADADGAAASPLSRLTTVAVSFVAGTVADAALPKKVGCAAKPSYCTASDGVLGASPPAS
jgi:hypothetical protein